MNKIPEWLSLAWAIVVLAAVRLWTWVGKHPIQLLVAVVAVMAANQSLSWVQRSSGRQFILYVGAPGTTGYRLGNRIAGEIRNTSPAPGVKYHVTVVPSHGVIDIEQQVGDDIEGRAIGMTVDGTQHDSDLRTLLPLDWDYLHVLASVKFMRRVQQERGGKWPEELSEVLRHLKPARSVFAGPNDSGTRRIASNVFDRYKAEVNDFVDPSLSDWEQAAVALKHGELDLAFYCGPIEAKTVREIAREGSAVLLGIKDITESLMEGDRFSLVQVEFPRHAYRADAIPLMERTAPPPSSGNLPPTTSPPPDLFFCGRDITTVAARRLIVVSKSMSNYDAFLICGAVKKMLVDERDLPANLWDHKPLTAPSAAARSDFSVPIHPGAELVRKGTEYTSWWNPASWDSTVRSLVLGVLTLLTTSCLQILLGSLKTKEVTDTAPATPPRALLESVAPAIKLSEDRLPLEAVASSTASTESATGFDLHSLKDRPFTRDNASRVLTMLRHPSIGARHVACTYLCEYGVDADGELKSRAIDALRRALVEERDVGVRIELCKALSWVGEGRAEVDDFLRSCAASESEDSAVRSVCELLAAPQVSETTGTR